MKNCFIIFIFFVSACATQPELKLTDLKFPFPEKKGVLANSIDSTIFISEHNSRKDTVGLVTYDSLGHILYDGSSQWDTYIYNYDSSGLVKKLKYRDWDVYLRFDASYDFFPDSFLLVQHWTGDYDYTTRYKFNAKGYLIDLTSNDPDNLMDVRRRVRTIFEYNNDNDLVKRLDSIFHDNKLDEQRVTSIFYANGKVDSVVTITNDRWGMSKTVDRFDNNGLRTLTVKQEPDTVLPRIEYIHKTRIKQ